MHTGDSPVRRASDYFVTELSRWRVQRGMSKKQLAAAMGFDPSYVSHVEARRHRPTEDFARRAEAVLQAGGAIWGRFREYDELRGTARTRPGPLWRDPPVPEQWLPAGAGLIVEREAARLSYSDGYYHCVVERALHNAGTEPVARYLVRVAVDRYPTEPDRSNRHHRERPLSWQELDLRASCAGEPMLWRPKTDRDAFKEAWLVFENERSRFPLYPGQRVSIEYDYRVGADKWGRWFQRAVRVPTRRMEIRVEFPADMRPVVWGVETSLATEAVPLRTPIEQELAGERAVFSWATDAPALHARYRLEWRFRSEEPLPPAVPAQSPRPAPAEAPASERMRSVGIVQRGADVLAAGAHPIELPDAAAAARELVRRLFAMLDRVGGLHPFGKGVGLAAPQLGLGLAAVVVRPAAGEPIVLLNPRVVAQSESVDVQYEGCLSFFDVRGRVGRPLWIDVEHTDFDGRRHITRFERAVARLVAHEIDHLEGTLYADRMPAGEPLVPVAEYTELGRPWRY